MGASNRGIALGSPHNSVWLHTSVWPKPPRFDGVHLTVVSSASKASVLHQELSSLLLKGAIEEVPQSDLNKAFSATTFLYQRRTHSGPASSEPLPLQREVQDVDVEDYYVPDWSGKLVCHCRPEGCQFSHSGRPAAQKLPSVCLWRIGLPV